MPPFANYTTMFFIYIIFFVQSFKVCALTRKEIILNPSELIQHHHQRESLSYQQQILANPGLSYDEVLNDDFQFDMNAHDVMVFLHIQKTGGTSFGKHLVRDLDLKVSWKIILRKLEETLVALCERGKKH